MSTTLFFIPTAKIALGNTWLERWAIINDTTNVLAGTPFGQVAAYKVLRLRDT